MTLKDLINQLPAAKRELLAEELSALLTEKAGTPLTVSAEELTTMAAIKPATDAEIAAVGLFI